MINALAIGSCRVKRQRAYDSKKSNVKLQIVDHHIHNPFEVVQLLQAFLGRRAELYFQRDWLHNEIAARSALPVDYYDQLKGRYFAADVLLIELSSLKRLLYYERGCEIDCNLTAIKSLDGSEQLPGEIGHSNLGKDDYVYALSQIITLAYPKRLLFVPHFPFSADIKVSNTRDALREIFFYSMESAGGVFYDPYPDIVSHGVNRCTLDSSHYTEYFEKVLSERYTEEISRVFSC